MKTLFICLSFLATFSVMSCDNKKTVDMNESVDTTAVDTSIVDSLSIDSLVTDSVATDSI